MSLVRVAACGDIHFTHDSASEWAPRFAEIGSEADVLLVAGDLTHHGLVEEAQAVADVLGRLPVPVVSVLGNHDYHQGADGEIRRLLERAGVRMLERETVVMLVNGRHVGIAGAKGFGGGFGMSSGSEFGEPEMKAFIRATKQAAHALFDGLSGLRCDVRLALVHYSPSRETVAGERPEIEPFLGSYLLGEAIDGAGCDLAIHGHAHHGAERGFTAGGTTVRNVAVPVIRAAYRVFEFS